MKSLPLAFLIAFFMPTVFCSSLGLKGHKEVHDHAAVDVPLHQQVSRSKSFKVILGYRRQKLTELVGLVVKLTF